MAAAAASEIRRMATGVLAGLAASWIMDVWQSRTMPMLAAYNEREGWGPLATDPAVVMANDMADMIERKPLPASLDRDAGLTVHYGFGAAAGAFFALMARQRRGGLAAGAGFGAALDLCFDEGIMPVMS